MLRPIKSTEEQLHAIMSAARVTLVVSGPGTGKTFTLARRIRYLTSKRGVLSGNILVFTFSNKAAAGLEDAASTLCPNMRFPWLGTTHGICGRILEQEGHVFDICDQHRQRQIVDSIFKATKHTEGISADDIIEYISWRKTRIVPDASPPACWDSQQLQLLRKAYKHYQRVLAEGKLKDFSDLLKDAVTLLEKSSATRRRYQQQFQHILADELQDFSQLQVRLLDLLSSTQNHLFLVGDDDQTIYTWLGADPLLMKKLLKRCPDANIVRLQHNFRSRPEIVEASSAVISKNKSRISKRLIATRETGHRIHICPCDGSNRMAESIANKINTLIERDGILPEKIAVLGRVRIALRNTKRVLQERGIPCAEPSTTNQKATILLLNYLRAVAEPHNEQAFSTIVNTPRRGIGAKTVARVLKTAKQRQCSPYTTIKCLIASGIAHKHLQKFSRQYRKLRRLKDRPPLKLARAVIKMAGLDEAELSTLLKGMKQYPNTKRFLADYKPYSHKIQDNGQQGVQFLTIHSSKGLEFDGVFFVGLEHGVLPDARTLKNPSALEEERRLMYVGMTRARDRLFLYYLKESNRFTGMRESAPSRFILEIPEDCKYYPSARERSNAPCTLPVDATFKDYLSGDTVHHTTHGYGKIIKVREGYARIKFNSSGIKKISVSDLVRTRSK